MTIGIDINDVLRDFTMNYAKLYQRGYNHEFDYDDLELWTNDISALFPFKSDGAYKRFTYEDFVCEIFGGCPSVETKTTEALNKLTKEILPNIDTDEPIKVIVVSPMEYGRSIPATLFFLSKMDCEIRDILLPDDSSEIWNVCDALITANPLLLNTKPEGKVSVKIEQEYNNECESDFSYGTFVKFTKNEENVLNVINRIKDGE